MIQHNTTDASAAAAGATVTPTEQKQELEPAVHGPETGAACNNRSEEKLENLPPA